MWRLRLPHLAEKHLNLAHPTDLTLELKCNEAQEPLQVTIPFFLITTEKAIILL